MQNVWGLHAVGPTSFQTWSNYPAQQPVEWRRKAWLWANSCWKPSWKILRFLRFFLKLLCAWLCTAQAGRPPPAADWELRRREQGRLPPPRCSRTTRPQPATNWKRPPLTVSSIFFFSPIYLEPPPVPTTKMHLVTKLFATLYTLYPWDWLTEMVGIVSNQQNFEACKDILKPNLACFYFGKPWFRSSNVAQEDAVRVNWQSLAIHRTQRWGNWLLTI